MDKIVGNDISSFQGYPDFNILVKNANFIITKVTEGVSYVNPYFYNVQREARRVGLPLGYYHFAKPSLGYSPESEADFFLDQIGGLREGEILCLDYEDDYTGNVVMWCLNFLDHIYLHTKVKPLIYLNKSLVTSHDWSPVAKAGYGLWLACYDDNLISGDWEFVAMQQWTSSQQVPGLAGNVDGDYFFGTTEQFKAYGYHFPQSPSNSISRSMSPSHSLSASLSPSATASPSISPSPSDSPSTSPSASASNSFSASPSPSLEIPEEPFPGFLQLLWQWILHFFGK